MASTTKRVRLAVSSDASIAHSSFRPADWPKKLQALLPASRPYLDSVVDSGGGKIVNQVTRVLKNGGIVSCYGMTAGGDVPIGMGFVLKNCEFKGELSALVRGRHKS